MIANVWNISCGCDQAGHVYRFDVEKCVDSDECFSKERDDNGVEKKRCPAG
jgi:alpha-tubulin suppressor-like RCC1 family protein